MPALRVPITKKYESLLWVCRFKHPLSKKTIRVALGPDQKTADGKLLQLNRAFMDQTQWANPTCLTSKDVRDAWNGAKAGVRVTKRGLEVDGISIDTNDTEAGSAYESIIAQLANELAETRAEATKYRRQLEAVLGSKIRSGPCPTLCEALVEFKKNYLGRDNIHARNVFNDLGRFVARFDDKTTLDEMEGKEKSIDGWLRGLTKTITLAAKGGDEPRKIEKPISAGRRQQIRMHILKFLSDAGANINRKLIERPGRGDVRADRGPIRWLDKKEAEALAKALEWKAPTGPKKKHAPNPATPTDKEYYSDLFRVQCAIGLRPDELITLHRQNFTEDFSRLTLAPLETLTLKQGSRTIAVPVAVRAIINKRLRKSTGGIVFAHPDTAEVWPNALAYNRRYRVALEAARVKAGIETRVDCRTGRRTCGSILIRNGLTITQVSAVLGDREQTIKEHYAQLLPVEVDTTAAALG